MPPEIHFNLADIDLSRIVADKEAIRKILPQRFEMEQLDAIVHVDPQTQIVIGYKDIKGDEFWIRGHMPGYPLMPGVMMCEAAAQLSSYYAALYVGSGDFIGFAGMENVRFRGTVHVGDRLVLVGKAIKLHRRQTIFNVQGFVGSAMMFHGDVIGVPMMRSRETTTLPGPRGCHSKRCGHFCSTSPILRDVRPENLPTAIDRLDWGALFGRAGPVEIEIGFGKGMFLCDAARAFPATSFLGIEIERKYVLSTAGRLAKHSLSNVKVACTEARWFLEKYVRETSVATVHVYFPDPWWKKRHKKRKLFTADFARQVHRVLAADGVFHFATDVKEYFDESLSLVNELGLFRKLPVEANTAALMTNFERKYIAEGRPIYRTHFGIC